MNRVAIVALCAGGLLLAACETEHYRHAYYGPGYRYYSSYGPGYRYGYYGAGYRYGFYRPGPIAPIGEQTTTYRTYHSDPSYWDTGDARARSSEFLGMH
jgi:hypothetical protein